MSLRLRNLQLRVQTGEGLFGTQIKFNDGLVLLRADNTKGKSTCVQAIIYALGLERMLGPSNNVPLPPVMTSLLEDGHREIPVIESEVLLEIENHKGESLTIQRAVTGERDKRLITTWEGARLTNPNLPLPTRDYYVQVAGAAQNEAGFLRKLAEFIGFQLPSVRRFTGNECPLYLEAIFPLFIVEQKHGWAGIQANLPTYLGIREMAKRCAEYVLNLDIAQLVEERQRLEMDETELKTNWKNLFGIVTTTLKSANARVVGLPEQPSAQWPLSVSPIVEVFHCGAWLAIETALTIEKERYSQLDQIAEPCGINPLSEVQNQLKAVLETLADRELVAAELIEDLQREQLQHKSTETRLAILREDLRRNKDSLKLKQYGSSACRPFADEFCPTCQQRLVDSLLQQGQFENPMSLEDNIAFIDNQIKTFDNLRVNSESLMSRKDAELAFFREDIDRLHVQVRALRQTLLNPDCIPSVEAIRLRLEIEGRIRLYEKTITAFNESMESFSEVVVVWRSIQERKRNLPIDGLSNADKHKLARLKELLREQLKEFEFSSLNPDTLDFSLETYRPTRDGFDLGFDISASDNIRLIWAYLQALLELSTEQLMNHAGLLLFDEPRQQEAAKLSFRKLLIRSAKAKARGQQIIFATSEPLAEIQGMTENLDVQIVNFEGRVILRM